MNTPINIVLPNERWSTVRGHSVAYMLGVRR
jgi:hypothetical protein